MSLNCDLRMIANQKYQRIVPSLGTSILSFACTSVSSLLVLVVSDALTLALSFDCFVGLLALI